MLVESFFVTTDEITELKETKERECARVLD